MAYLIEPTNDLRDSWLAAQREHAEVDGHTEAGGHTIEDLESGDSIDGIVQSLLAGTAVLGTDPGLTCEWWWVEPAGDEGLEYIGRAVLRPEPRPDEGHLHIAIRPSRRRQGHGTQLLLAALPIAASRGLPSVVLAFPHHDVAAHQLAHRTGATLIASGPVDRFNIPTMSTAQ